MTILGAQASILETGGPRRVGPRQVGVRRVEPRRPAGRRRPAAGRVQYRRPRVALSRAVHRRPITPAKTVVLALVAAGITVWLGLVAQVGGVLGPRESVPPRLAVVQVHAGETLHQVAQRVAPQAPVGAVVERIRELNGLHSSAVNAGQTLLAPVG
ncbi:LysM peptidoglycan-binding domain-containing protein [uncultured Mycolicibacterium sp.]|uniref:LysM peptidoglycan-binding domain-containing protein n=1 Tax=uncultured Mycolicibacterium sp. TaxID=2320817 RepID=UPI002623772B|nr:LysM peptidoglycan-binding domain-containing protein [uncultured Mycolicibacterium sp.]